MKTTITAIIQNDPQVLQLQVKDTFITSMTYNGVYTHFSIHNMPLDSIVAFRDSLDKAIEEETTRQLNEIGSIPNVPESKKDLNLSHFSK
jgi:hypothetical protein